MVRRLGRWAVLGMLLTVIMGCQSWGSSSTVYVYDQWRPPTPSYQSRDQRYRASDYYSFYQNGGYDCGDC